jgi:molybdate transport system substrate-binding protein
VRIRGLAVVAAAAAVLLTACAQAPRTLTVFAAASLTDTFTELGKRFETDNPGVTVKFSYAGSSELAQQIVNGAPADVFAAASDATMKTVVDAGQNAAPPKVFATNVLQIAAVKGNPKGITTFADLTKPDLKVVVCAPQVPCGAAEQKIEKAAGVTLKPVSQESDVKSVLSKVASGDADAGLVYVTDVASAKGTVAGIDFPESAQAKTNYPIAVVKGSKQADLAGAFLALVSGDTGKKTLGAVGFGTP